jgi:uncharacterized iron-regulated membrane protein
MKRYKGIILSISLMILGFILNGLAWKILHGPTLSSLGLTFGLGLSFVGFILFFKNINKK